MSDTAVRRHRNHALGRESAWVADVVADHAVWSQLVAIPAVVSFDLEYQVSPIKDNLGMARRKGFPRIDALLRHEDGGISLLEAKLETSPQAIMGAVGQLLYYRTILRRSEKIIASNLIIAAPVIPPLVGEMLEECGVPINLLMVQANTYEGLVPKFGAHATRH